MPEIRRVSGESDSEALARAAREVSESAYCPYSRFSVGAAVLAGDGRIFAGSNVENASYGLTICAERSALVQASAAGVRAIRRVAIYTPTARPTMPCGACRQFIREFGEVVEIASRCDGAEIVRSTIAELLPRAFGPEIGETRGSGEPA